MNLDHVTNWEYKATAFAEEIHLNEEKKKYFLAGVKWCVEALDHTTRNTGHPMASPSDNAYLANLTIKDVRRFVKTMLGPKGDEK